MEDRNQGLTKEHAKWIEQLEAENPDLPIGYARAIVQWYLEDPDVFTEEQIEKWQNTPVPKLERTQGHAETYTGAEAEALYQKMLASCSSAQVVPLEENSSTLLKECPTEA